MISDSSDSVEVASSDGCEGLKVSRAQNTRRESRMRAHSFRFTSNSVIRSDTRLRSVQPSVVRAGATTCASALHHP